MSNTRNTDECVEFKEVLIPPRNVAIFLLSPNQSMINTSQSLNMSTITSVNICFFVSVLFLSFRLVEISRQSIRYL